MKLPKLTIALSLIIVIAYLLLSSMLVFSDKNNIEQFGFSKRKITNILSYNFVHSSYAHLLANLAIIIASGIVVESALEKKDFIALFFGGAMFSAIVFCTAFPKYNLVGASAGAVSLLGAAILIDPKKTAVFATACLLGGFIIISGISLYIESSQKNIAEEITLLSQERVEAIHSGDYAKAEQISEKINEKEDVSAKISEGENLKSEVPPNFEIHLLAAFFGTLYVATFRRNMVEKTALRIHHLLRP